MKEVILALIGEPLSVLGGIIYIVYRINLGMKLTDLEINLLKPQSLQTIPHSKIYSYLTKQSIINLLMLLFLLMCFAAKDLFIFFSQANSYKEPFSSEHMHIYMGCFSVVLSMRMETKIQAVQDRL